MTLAKLTLQDGRVNNRKLRGVKKTSRVIALFDSKGKSQGYIDVDGFLNKPVEQSKGQFVIVYDQSKLTKLEAIEAIENYQNQKEVVWYDQYE